MDPELSSFLRVFICVAFTSAGMAVYYVPLFLDRIAQRRKRVP